MLSLISYIVNIKTQTNSTIRWFKHLQIAPYLPATVTAMTNHFKFYLFEDEAASEYRVCTFCLKKKKDSDKGSLSLRRISPPLSFKLNYFMWQNVCLFYSGSLTQNFSYNVISESWYQWNLECSLLYLNNACLKNIVWSSFTLMFWCIFTTLRLLHLDMLHSPTAI